MASKATGFFGLRLTPEEIDNIQSRAKAEGMTRSAWAKRRLLSVETAGTESLVSEIARQHEQTRDLIREKNRHLAEAMKRELKIENTSLGIVISTALEAVAVAVKNAGERSR
jgi:uncharacterized FlaG/YvyC family protein